MAFVIFHARFKLAVEVQEQGSQMFFAVLRTIFPNLYQGT